ncbi:MAG: c-type cytochrome domain-containing protein [Planctomycetaceae bacterium]
MTKRISACVLTLAVISVGVVAAEQPNPPDFGKQVAPLLKKYCVGCHNAAESNGKLMLQSFTGLQKGGEHGAVIVPGEADKSRMILALEKKAEPFMPPEGEKAPTADEIALLKAWINAGAKGPLNDLPDPASIVTPKIAPTGDLRKPISAVAVSPDGQWIAVARYGVVEILAAGDRKPVAALTGHTGQANDVVFSSDGSVLVVASGEAGLVGEATIWNTSDWSKKLVVQGHADTLYAADLSPDGTLLATGSYDRKIKLWSTATGDEVGELAGHNDAVFDLAFRNDGKLLASASGDKTVKLWDVAKRERLDTFIEPTEAQYAVAFSPDGRYVVAGGVDNRIRVWEVLEGGREGTNPIRYARFAHEAPVLELRFSPNGKVLLSSSQDHTIKIWETDEFTQLDAIKGQPDWVSSLAVTPDASKFLAGRLDGTLTSYPVNTSGVHAARPEPILNVPVVGLPADGNEAAARPELAEVEPNDGPEQATSVAIPATVRGVLRPESAGTEDADIYRFEARAGQTWILETAAARDKSPADTKIEVLHADGRPVQRLLLRAVRDSYITFRPINSTQGQVRVQNWEEMKLKQYMYLGGEVCKLFQAPRGPDSGWDFFTSRGMRRCYFDTSGTIHANGEPVYIVEPYLPGTQLVDNGLPVFVLNYVNDDDGQRELGSDSRLTFTAPADGAYLVRVRDVRGFGGDDYKYALTIREPRPDFRPSLGGRNPTIGAGSAREFSVHVDRIDNFDGDVRFNISGLPPGFQVSSPIVVEAGHAEAQGVVSVAADVEPTKTADDPVTALKPGQPNPELQSKIDFSTVKLTAVATVLGQRIEKPVENLGELKVARRPGYVVRLLPDTAQSTAANEIVMSPGTTTTAMLRLERNGYQGEMRFDVNNLPHGVIVDNIGLSGVLIRQGESERRIFLTAADWVGETTRLIHAIARAEGNEVSLPVQFRIGASGQVAKAAAAPAANRSQ